MGKSVAIVTLVGYFNYGNRLQNYALQRVLDTFGFNVETLIFNSRRENNENELRLYKRVSNLRKMSVYDILSKGSMKLWSYINKNKLIESNTIRTDIFKRFTNDYIRETEYSLSNNNIPESLSEKYDYFITGSDQVWNPAYNKSSSIYFLTFASKEKRIAYAPSFGVSEIRDEFIDRYLSNLDYLLDLLSKSKEKELLQKYLVASFSKYDIVFVFYACLGHLDKNKELSRAIIASGLLKMLKSARVSQLLFDTPSLNELNAELRLLGEFVC